MLGVAWRHLRAPLPPITIVQRRWAPTSSPLPSSSVVIGRLGSFWGAGDAALLVGVVRGITIHFALRPREASMYVLMFVVLLLRRCWACLKTRAFRLIGKFE